MNFIKIAFVALATTFAATVNADYFLYWDTSGYKELTGGESADIYARLYYTTAADTAGSVVPAYAGDSTGAFYYYGGGKIVGQSNVTGKDDGYFYIDIVNNGTTVYSGFTVGNVVSYANLFNDGYIRTIGSGSGNWNAVPEPTGGMLVLVGLALLGLRRRKSPADFADNAE